MSIQEVGIDWGLVAAVCLASILGFVTGAAAGSRATLRRGLRRTLSVVAFFSAAPLVLMALLVTYAYPVVGCLSAAAYGIMQGFIGFCAETV